MIAHSTIYKAVHGLGKSITDSDDRIRAAIRELHNKYLKDSNKDVTAALWPPEKALYKHTKEREAAIRFLLSPFLMGSKNDSSDLPRLFYTYTRAARVILSNSDPPVRKIYNK